MSDLDRLTEAVLRAAHLRTCRDCGTDFSSFEADETTLCGNCSATTHLPRCGHETVVHLGLGSIEGRTCQRPLGHTGHHAYGQRRS